MNNGFSIFDTHTHIGVGRHNGRMYTAAELLRNMDRYGVDRSAVIPFPVVDDPRAAHDEIARAVREHPDRLCGVACMYPYIPEHQFRDEMRRCREDLGFVALKWQPQYQPLNPLWDTSDFFFETAREHRWPIICHTGSGIPYALPSMIMVPAAKFPEVTFILAHCGGGGIFSGEAIVAARFCPNIYLEVSSLMPHQVLEVLRHVSSGRVMAGSDLPENLDIEMDKIVNLEIAEADRRNILWDTARKVFG